jgi:hypothetical protein
VCRGVDHLNQIKTVPGSAFEVVDTGPLRGQVTPTPVGSPTPSPTPTPVCTPRPPVTVAVAASGAGRLSVTISTAGTNVRLLRLTYGSATNARIDVGTLVGGTGSFNFNLPAGTTSQQFFVRQGTAGQSTTVPLTVVDSCGAWPTFVGGGASAF